MSDDTDWLPPLVLLKDYRGEWELYLNTIYRLFCQDFIASKFSFQGKRFGLKRHPIVLGKEAAFWHLISEGTIEEERLPDLRRCERIRWPKAIMDAVASTRVKVWKNKRGNEERVILALHDFSYVVILADRGEYILLWTAYCVERDHQRRKLRQEYEQFVATKKS